MLLLFATPSAGSTSTYFSPATASFSLRAGNGYRIAVERSHGQISLTAFHGGKSFFVAATYTVPAKASPQRIDANFGKFGRISVRLKTERMHKGGLEEQCAGKPETVRYGVFVGTIRFRGERGYTSVSAQHAEGRLSSGLRIKCVFPNLRPGSGSRARGSRQEPPFLSASQGRHRFFGVDFSSGKHRSILYSAGTLEQRGRMEIFRDVLTEAPLDSFAFASDLSTATVQPPPPFHGEASFQRTSSGPTWSGTLGVALTGRDDVSLAGPRFDAQLARDGSSDTFFSFSR